MASSRVLKYLVVFALLTVATISVPAVHAASISVDKAIEDDANPGTCTLADAITAANTDTATDGCTAGSGADTITLGVNITLNAPLPDITSEITIEGAEYDIDGVDDYQIFYVDGGDLTIKNITLTRGNAGEFGGAIYADGGSLTVTNSRLENSEAGLLGGAIETSNTNVTIRNSIFVGNSSGSLGGAISFFSLGPNDGTAWTDDMEVKTLLIDQTTFGGIPQSCDDAGTSAHAEKNFAESAGGAIRIAGGDVTIRRSSFVGNKAGVDGGAIYASAWRFLFENNTVSCNRADGDGGGMYVIVGDLILRHSTIFQNSAGDEGSGLYAVDDTGRDQDNEEEGLGLYLQNSIIAISDDPEDYDDDCGDDCIYDCVAHDTIDHNIGMYVGDGSCESVCSIADGELEIGDLQGEPAYHPIQDGSIAINRADQEVCSLPASTETSDTVESQQVQDFTDVNICDELDPLQDQIGTNRPMYGSCDIGAIESRTGVEYDDPPTDVPPTDTDVPQNPPPTDTDVPLQPEPTDTDVPIQPEPTDTDVPRDPPPTDTDVPVQPEPTDTDVPLQPEPTDTDVPGQPEPTDTDVPVQPEPTDTDVPGQPEATDTSMPTTTPTLSNAELTGTATAKTATKVAFDQTSTALAMTATPSSLHLTGTAAAKTATKDAYDMTSTALAMTATPSSLDLTDTALAMTATTAPTLAGGVRSPTENQCIHSVVAGDTLYWLALNNVTTVDAIKYLNQLSGDILYVGQQLFIPGCFYETGDDGIENASLLYICQSMFESIVVRSTNNDISCRQVDTNTIDKHPALATGMLGAVEVLGFVDQGVEICFRTTGTLVFLDPITWPPSVIPMPSYSNSAGLTCGQVERVGTVVLVATATEIDSLILLTNCRVTTAQILRLREEVGSESIIGLVPYNVELTASARTANWFQVSFLGNAGWISAQYVGTEGICE